MTPWQPLDPSAGPDRRRRRRAQALARHGTRMAIAVGMGIATYFCFPTSPAADVPLLEVGSVSPRDVIAPFGFRVAKRVPQLERERTAAERAVPPVFASVPAAVDSARAQLTAFFARMDRTRADSLEIQRVAGELGVPLTAGQSGYLRVPRRRTGLREALERALDVQLAAGVAASHATDGLRGLVTVRSQGDEHDLPVDSVPVLSEFITRARRANPQPGAPTADAVFTRLLVAFFHPTLVLDPAETARRREAARGAIATWSDEVKSGEKILGAHEVVGREDLARLRALRDELQGRGGVTRRMGRVIGAVTFNTLLVVLFGVTLLLFRPALYGSLRALITIAVSFLVVIGAAAFIARADPVRPELIPMALAATVLAVLFDPRISLVGAMNLAVLIGGQTAFRGTNALFLCLAGGVAAAFTVRVVRRRNQAYYSILTVAAAYLVAAAAIGLMLDWSARDILSTAMWGALSAVLSVSLAMVLLPTAEELAGVDTYLKLLEWSDLNRPLMQQLSREAPGTYHHTIVTANLVEAACTAIGANGLLGRVGAYYHDIGKLKKPQYFVENQVRGRNPHDKLKPGTSASIIRGHIKDGLELAEANRLPQAVRAFIAEHHGTGHIAYFLEKARERDPAPAGLGDFQYPGPVPQTVETAVCMLADGVEAATRVLSDPTPQRIRDVIDLIVRQRIEQGQLRDAPITLRQLELVKDQFARVLIGAYHNRIDYPSSSGGITSEFARA